MQYIASNFNKDTDPALLDKTAGFFLQHEQYDKAVDLYVASVQAIKALELCLQYNINIRYWHPYITLSFVGARGVRGSENGCFCLFLEFTIFDLKYV